MCDLGDLNFDWLMCLTDWVQTLSTSPTVCNRVCQTISFHDLSDYLVVSLHAFLDSLHDSLIVNVLHVLFTWSLEDILL